MTAITLVGQVTDRLGHAEHRSYSWDGRTAIETRSYAALASIEYRSAQAAHIAIDRDHHHGDLGEVVHLEWTADDSIIAVAVVDDLDELLTPSHPPVYWSPHLRYRHGGHDIEIRSIAVTDDPATCGLAPLEVLCGDVRDVGWRARWHNRTPHRALLERAADAHLRRRWGAPITIVDPAGLAGLTRVNDGLWLDRDGNPIPSEDRHATVPVDDDYQRPMGPIEYRPGRVIAVH